MTGRQWFTTIADLGNSVWENAALPKSYWNKDEGYNQSNIHIPPTFAGVGDGVVEEISNYPQLVKLGYDVATKKDVREGLWNSVKNITPESIKNAAINFYEEKKNNYTSDKSYIVNHTVGKDAVAIASLFMGGGATKGLKEATNNIDDGIKKVGKEIKKKNITENLDDISSKILNSGEDFTILKKVRNLPGIAKGTGSEITGKWLKGTDGNAGLFPKSVADKLRGKEFKNFDEFRKAFWKEVANDSHLSKQFTTKNVDLMKNGLSPEVLESQRLGGQIKYILHHKTPINQGGGVYDVDNLYIVTPRYHKEILAPDYHYGYGYK